MAMLLYGEQDLVALVATECSTFIHMNSGTSKRSVGVPDGDPEVVSVLRGNALAAVTALLLLLLALTPATFLLEQPGSSVLILTRPMQWLIMTLESVGVQIFKQPFWMGCWGHWSPKRTILWSNNPLVRLFTTHGLAMVKNTGPSTTKRYVSKSGKSGYTGSQHLKSTEYLGFIL